MTMKTIDDVAEATDVLKWLIDQVQDNFPESENKVEMESVIVVVMSYLVQYQHEIVVGKRDHLAALEHTIKGDSDVTQYIEKRNKSLN